MVYKRLARAWSLSVLTSGAAIVWCCESLASEPPRVHVQRIDRADAPRERQFHSYRGAIRGVEITEAAGTTIATINDLVINRGSGEVRWIVARTGGVMGMGGANRLLPFNDLHWKHSGPAASTSLTKAQLEALPEIDTNDWAALDWDPFNDNAPPDLAPLDRDFQDPYAAAFQRGNELCRIEGRVVALTRTTPEAAGQEYVIVTIQPVRGEAMRILFGPSWFVMGHGAAPARGQRATVSAVQDARDADLYIATDAEIEGRTITLRDRDGAPSWMPASNAADDGGAPHPYIFASTLVDAPVEALGDAAGEVHDLIIDVAGGWIEFVAIDPNENFLGMLDTIRLAPWEVTSYMPNDVVRIDATAAMITSGPELPQDVTTLNNLAAREKIYRHYELEPILGETELNAPSHDALKPFVAPRGWTSHDEYAQAVKNGDRVELRGVVVSVERISAFPGVDGPIAIVLLRGAAGDLRQVHLGPDSYFRRHALSLKSGDEVRIDARGATLDGHSFAAAHRIQRNGEWIVLWNEEGRPVWDTR